VFELGLPVTSRALKLTGGVREASIALRTPSQPMSLLPLLCARPRADDYAAARIRALAESGLDWGGLLVAAADHGVAPLVCQRLEALAGEALPPLWREQFQEEFARNTRRNLFLVTELFRVLEALGRRGVRATPYKGPVMAAQAYGDIALRQFADLDIVLPQGQIVEAHRALADLGFHSDTPGFETPEVSGRIPGQYAYRDNASGTYVELHTEATLRYAPRRLDLEPLLARLETISLAGQEVKTFAAEDALVLLSVHGSKHFWDRLGWIADIAALAAGPRHLDWELSLERARSLGAERMVLLSACLASELLETALPEGVMEHLSDVVRRRLLATPRVEPGMYERFMFRVWLCSSLGGGLRYVLRLATAPTEADRIQNPTAELFLPLYAILRPLRLARLYGWSARIPPASVAGRKHNHFGVFRR